MTIIQHKRGSSDKWTSLNPILAIGEIGYESNTGKFKIGDGSSSWSSLSYFSTSTGETPPGSGTVTSVDITLPTGLVVTGNPITAAGTLAVAYDTGYAIPTTAKQTEWDTAYGWGDHAAVGYIAPTTNSVITLTNNTSSTTTTTGALKVTGGVGIQENLNVGGNIAVTGNLTVNGTTSINSTTFTTDAPIITVGGDTAPGSDDDKDRGIAFRWHTGAQARIGFFGFDDSLQQLTFIPNATITGDVVSGTTGVIAANLNGVAASANELATPRYLWGQVFDGTDNVSGSLTDVGDISSPEAIFSISTTSATTVLGNKIEVTGGTTSNTVGTGGSISLTGGSATSATGANYGGSINIAAGASTLSTSGTGGSVSILAGNGQTKGTIDIGTSNTSAITIGAGGITTTIAGTLSASLSTLFISSPLSGTSYNGFSTVSIGLSAAYGDTQNPYGSKTTNYVLAGPAAGPSAAPAFRALVSADIPNLSGTYAALSGATFTGNVLIQTAGAASLSIGRVDGTSSTPYIDFNSGATTVDYDSRIIASGGTGTSGQGNLAFYAGASTFTGNATVTGDLTVTGGDIVLGAAGTASSIKTLATTGATSGSITIASGNVTTAGTSGDVAVDTGSGATGNGIVSIGTSNASGVTIGRAATTTTINGTLSATSIAASSLTGTIPGTVLGNSTVYVGTTAIALNRGTANQSLTGITSLIGGTGTTSMLIESADTSGVASGSVLVTSGDATSSTAGTVKVDSGSNGTPGSGGANVSIGTTNASSVTIGRSTTTTTINGTLSATASNATDAASADTVKTISTATNASFYPTFVDANNGTATSETVYTDAGLVYNPSSNTLTVGGNLVVGGVSIQVEGATDNTFETLLTVTDPTADRTITFPDATGTVALTSDISGFVTSVTGTSPVNSSGGTTPAISLATSYGDTQNPYGTKTTNYVLAGPAAGPSASPAFRALVSADIPDLSGTYLTTGGTATNSTNINISTTTGNTSDTTLYPVFVGANTTGAQAPHTDIAGIVYNASTDSLSLTGDLTVSGGDVVLGSTGTATTIKTLATTGTASGSLTISTGDTTTSGASGNISIDVGNGVTDGTISIGTGNASGITIGKAGTTTTIAGTLSATVSTATNVTATVTGTNSADLVYGNMADNDQFRIRVGGTATNAGFAEIATADDGTEPIYVRQYTGVFSTIAKEATILDGSGNTILPGDLTIQGGDLLTNQTTFNLINTTATTLNIGGGATGAVNIGSASGTVNLAGSLDLRAGGTTAETAPLYFSSSTSLLSTPVAGAVEYNNKALYFTPDTTPGRALVSTPFYKIISTTEPTISLAGGTAGTLSAFGTNGIALDTGVAYEVEMLLFVSSTASSNSCTLIVTPGSASGAATPSSTELYYDYSSSTTVLTNAAALSGVLRTGTTSFPALNTITIATGTTNYLRAFMKGIVDIGTGGNFTIRLAYAPGAGGSLSATVLKGSYIKITPIGSEDVSEVGTWA